MPQKKTISVDDLVFESPTAKSVAQYARAPMNANEIDYAAAKPSLLSDPQGWWKSLSDDEKQAVLNNIGEFAGGTVGAAAGGGTPASMLGAGVGAIGGRSIAGLAGKAVGLKSRPRTAREEAAELATAGAANVLGEGVGRAVPAMLKAALIRLARHAIPVNPETARLATEAGADLTPGMLSSNAMPKYIERALEKAPGGTGPIREATQRAAGAYERRVRDISSRLHPEAVSDQETGRALGEALGRNRETAADFFKQRYGAVRKMVGDEPIIDVTPLRDSARAIVEGLPVDAKNALPASTFSKLRQIAGMEGAGEGMADEIARSTAGVPFSVLPPDRQQAVLKIMQSMGGSADSGPRKLTFDQATALRTELLNSVRALSVKAPTLDRRALPALVDGIDSSIENSLSNNPEVLSRWRAVNDQYKTARQQLYGPASRRRTGNPVAESIENSVNQPEKAIGPASQNVSAVQQTRSAVSPTSPARFGAPVYGGSDPIPLLQRNRMDNAIEGSLIDNKYLSNERHISPIKLGNKLQNEGTRELLGGEASAADDAVKLGRAVYEPLKMDNVSETSRFSRLAAVGAAGGLAAIPGEGWSDRAKHAGLAMGTAVVLPRMASKAWLGPVKRAISGPVPPVTVPSGSGGAFYGALGRLATQAAMPDEPPALQRLDVPAEQRKKTMSIDDIL